MATFIYSVRKLKKAAKPWLTDEDYPAVVALEAMARELDAGPVQAAMLNAFGQAYRALLKRKPGEAPAKDALEEALGAIPDD
ncbi:MAG: hypothetical protein KF739_04620 [Cryobacterium sp.]|nr:hypothetical protein [Cryobacterium sp.]